MVVHIGEEFGKCSRDVDSVTFFFVSGHSTGSTYRHLFSRSCDLGYFLCDCTGRVGEYHVLQQDNICTSF